MSNPDGGLQGRVPNGLVPGLFEPQPSIPAAMSPGNHTNMTSFNSTASTGEDSQLASLIFVGVLLVVGVAGTVMNTGVLVVVFVGRLVKKDYRMIYYIFITVGDLLFAVHTVINALSLFYKDFYVFKIFAVCLNLHITMGLVSYQWSAICIVLLLIDLVWSLRNPFGEDGPKKKFSYVGCITTFFVGVGFAILPFAYWNDSPAVLPFCSIANVYGSHWNEYQYLATSVLSFLFIMMLGSSLVLIYYIYRTHTPHKIRDMQQDTKVEHFADDKGDPKQQQAIKPPVSMVSNPEPEPQQTQCPSPHPNKRYEVNKANSCPGDINRRCDKEEINTIAATVPEGDALNGNGNYLHRDGVDNQAFHMETTHVHVVTHVTTPKVKSTKTPRDKIKPRDSEKDQDEVQESQADVQRKQFTAACRNVGVFMATYFGCCLPYYILLIVTLDCAPACFSDTPEQRTIRVATATFLYVLPILDPILYTQRFSIFKKAAMEAFGSCCRR